MDSSEKYGGDLEVEAEFTAHCSDESKPGKVKLELHLSQDTTEIYSYLCDGSTNVMKACAEAIVKTMSRPNMRFVTVKSVEQQDMQATLCLASVRISLF